MLRRLAFRAVLVRLSLVLFLLMSGAGALWGQSTYQIQSATPSTEPAGANGATIGISGTLPDFTQGAYQVCFYTGFGSTAALTPSVVQGVDTISVPASTIQAIPPASFTATNGYQVQAMVYVVTTGTVCNGQFDGTLTNSFPVAIADPTFGGYSGPTSVPQTNSATGQQAPPTSITLPGNNFVAGTTVTFGTFGTVTPTTITPSSIIVPVPAAFSSSAPGTTATLTVCNGTFCSSPATPITLTVMALYPSAGTITATPSPVTTSGQSVLTAQFTKATGSNLPDPGAPSGNVTFTAAGTAQSPTKLVLDKTAAFAAQTSTLSVPTTATPTFSPAAGSYLNSVTITLADATPGAAVYYTQDGSNPTTGSTLYTGPFTITTSQTIKAIAVVAGYLNSAVASAAYVITISPPTKLAFLVQPTNTATGAPITPAVQVAIEDVNGVTVTSDNSAVTIAIGANPGNGILGGTTTVNAVNGIATFSNLDIPQIANGYTLIATSASLTSATSSAFNITPYPITITVQSALIGIGSTLSGNISLGTPAPTGGVTVTLASDNTANVTIAPATVNIAAGQSTAVFTYTGVAAGTANLTASATNYLTGSVQVTATAAQVSLGMIPTIAPGQTTSLALSLPNPAPPGGTTVTFTSSNTAVATVTSSVFVPAGQQTASANPQVTGITIGTAVITASAPGFAPATRVVTVTVVASFNPSTTNINLTTSTNTTLNINAPAQAGGITFTLSSDNPAVATVPASVTLIAGNTSVEVPITGVSPGTTMIRADHAGVTEAVGTVNVVSQINGGSILTGKVLENQISLYLPVAPSNPTTVTITTNGPGIATISKSSSVVGVTTLTYTNVTSSYIGTIWVQGQSVGSTTLTISAPGYTNGTTAVTVDPSGFAAYGDGSFSTTTFSAPTTLTYYPVVLDPTTFDPGFGYTLNPGISPISLPVTSSNTAVGTITTSPIVFAAGATQGQSSFKPAGAGTSTVSIGTPTGFSTSALYTSLTATVTAPAITVSNFVTGVNIEAPLGIYLPVTPPNGVTVTVTSSAPGIVTFSNSATAVGQSTLTYMNVTSTNVATIWVQGQGVGAATITVAAMGYTSGTGTITVDPAGFAAYGDQSFSTTTLSTPNNLTYYPVALTPGTLAVASYGYYVSPGIGTVNVPVTSSNTAVGTILGSPIAFPAGASQGSAQFKPVGAGTTTVTVVAPTGFSTPTQYVQLTATVSQPVIGNQNLLTGAKLETPLGIYLPVTPLNPVTVTVTSNGPGIATLSNSATTVGQTTLTFMNTTSTNVATIFVQGQSVGTTTLTVSAPGYGSGTITVTVDPAGFAMYANDFTTTTFSAPSTFNVLPVPLNPGSLTVYTFGGYYVNPGIGTINVPITSSNPTIGTVTPAVLSFPAASTYATATFTPVSAGSTVLALTTPAGFSTPANYDQITATVTAPAISVNNSLTGVKLQTALGIYLPVAPPNPVTVTVTSNGPLIGTISNSNTVVGVTTLVFPNVTSTTVGTIYVQGQSLGSTTITVSAPGYTNGVGTITVYPSGFAFYGDQSFTTTATSAPTTENIYAVALNPGTLTVNQFSNLEVNPGIGTVNVPVTSSNTAVGTVTSPVVFNPGDYYDTTMFHPLASGTSTISIGTPTGFSTPSQYTQITATVQ